MTDNVIYDLLVILAAGLIAGVIAHKSALKDGEWMNVPQYQL